jgi:hypothetical protein
MPLEGNADIEGRWRVRFRRFGNSAATAQWVRGTPLLTEAVSVFVSGMNEDEDAEAVQSLRAGDSAGNPSPFYETTFTQLFAYERPFRATLCITKEARSDAVLIGLAEALGEVFFESVGIAAVEIAIDDPDQSL